MIFRYRPIARGHKVDAQHAQPSPRRVQMNATPAPVCPAVGEAPRQSRHDLPRKETVTSMLTRATTNAVAYRSSSMRRMRRRAVNATTRLYCATNGCTSFLVIDETADIAHCEICGYTRTLSH